MHHAARPSFWLALIAWLALPGQLAGPPAPAGAAQRTWDGSGSTRRPAWSPLPAAGRARKPAPP